MLQIDHFLDQISFAEESVAPKENNFKKKQAFQEKNLIKGKKWMDRSRILRNTAGKPLIR